MIYLELLRSIRIGPFAVFDFTITYLFAFLIGPYLKKIGIPLTREQLMYLVLPLSVITHLVFGVDTPLTKMILDPYGHFIWKAVIIFMIILAFVRRKVKL